MAFELVNGSRFRITINTALQAEKQLGQKFYQYNIIGLGEDEHQPIFDELVECCEGFATDYWVGGRVWNATDPTTPTYGHFFFFLDSNDAVTFKMMAGIYVEHSQVIPMKPLREAKRPKVEVHPMRQRMITTLKRMSTKILLHLQDSCYNNNGSFTSHGLTVHLDEINEVLKDRNTTK